MNVASRLVSLASPGEIIVSEQTYAQIADRIDAEQLAPVRVKGKADEMCVYRILGYHEEPTNT